MTERELLIWIHQRMVKVHGESPFFDYMHRLREVIARTSNAEMSSSASMTSMDVLDEIEKLDSDTARARGSRG